MEHALVVVVHGHGKDLLGAFLPDDVVIEAGLDLLRGEQVVRRFGGRLLGILFLYDGGAGRHARIADAHSALHDEATGFRAALAAEGAVHFLLFVAHACLPERAATS